MPVVHLGLGGDPRKHGWKAGAKEESIVTVSCCIHCAQAHGEALGGGLLPLRSEATGIFVLMKPIHRLPRVTSGAITPFPLPVTSPGCFLLSL